MRKNIVDDRSELVVADETSGDVIKVTATLKNGHDGGVATEMLQAVLKSSKSTAGDNVASEVHALADAFGSLDGAPAPSLGERVGW